MTTEKTYGERLAATIETATRTEGLSADAAKAMLAALGLSDLEAAHAHFERREDYIGHMDLTHHDFRTRERWGNHYRMVQGLRRLAWQAILNRKAA